MPVQTNHVGAGNARINFTGNPLTITGIYIAGNTFGGLVQYRSTTVPRRLMHGGWVALGAFGVTNRPYDHILWYKYVEFEAEWVKLSPSVVADFLEYYCPAGSFLDMNVNY